jgi:hypothetical protein
MPSLTVTLPALSKIWSRRENAPLASTVSKQALCASNFLAWKRHLVGDVSVGGLQQNVRDPASIWVLEQSSNGVTFGASDLISGLSDCIWNTVGSNHTWAVFYSASLQLRMCLALNATDQSYIGGFACEASLPYTGGSLTQRPTAPREFALQYTGGAPATSDSRVFFTDTATGNLNVTNFIASTDGGFVFMCSRPGSLGFTTVCALVRTVDATITDTRNTLFFTDVSTPGSRGAFQYTQLQAFSNVQFRNQNGSLCNGGGFRQGLTFGGTSWALGTPGVDSQTGQYLTDQLVVASLDGAQKTLRGRIADMFFIAGTPPVGQAFASGTGTAQEYVVVGDVLVPMPGGPVTL